MKTTNKILLAAFLVVLLATIVFMFFLRANISFEVVEGSGNVVRQERVTANFQHVALRGHLKAYIVQDVDCRVYIEADDNLVDLIVTEVDNGHLNVYFEKTAGKQTTLNVFIHVSDLEALHLSAGSQAYAEEPLTGKSFEHNVQTGAKSTLHLQYERADMKVLAGAITTLTGKVDWLTVLSAAGAIIDAKELMVKDCEIDAKAGSVNNLFVTGTLSGIVSRGAVIHYTGEPEIAGLDVKSGGHIETRTR